jgi:hypothetical protein
MSVYQSGELQFAVQPSSRRKTLGITVDRDSSLILHIPANAQQNIIDSFVKEKRLWVYEKLAEKALWIEKAYPPRQFVDGEGFAYLGRVYRLKIQNGLLTLLTFQNNRFLLAEPSAYRAKELFVDWYKQKALEYLPALVGEYTQRIDKETKGLRILDLSNRWASCSDQGVLNFHWKVMQLPNRYIRYIVAHEIAHLVEKHHTPQFWRTLERMMPDYEQHLGSLRSEAMKYMRVD